MWNERQQILMLYKSVLELYLRGYQAYETLPEGEIKENMKKALVNAYKTVQIMRDIPLEEK